MSHDRISRKCARQRDPQLGERWWRYEAGTWDWAVMMWLDCIFAVPTWLRVSSTSRRSGWSASRPPGVRVSATWRWKRFPVVGLVHRHSLRSLSVRSRSSTHRRWPGETNGAGSVSAYWTTPDPPLGETARIHFRRIFYFSTFIAATY